MLYIRVGDKFSKEVGTRNTRNWIPKLVNSALELWVHTSEIFSINSLLPLFYFQADKINAFKIITRLIK